MDNYTLVRQNSKMISVQILLALKHYNPNTPKGYFRIKVHSLMQTSLVEPIDLMKRVDLKNASFFDITLKCINLTLNLKSFNVRTLYEKLVYVTENLSALGVQFELNDLYYTYPFIKPTAVITTEMILLKEVRDMLSKLYTDSKYLFVGNVLMEEERLIEYLLENIQHNNLSDFCEIHGSNDLELENKLKPFNIYFTTKQLDFRNLPSYEKVNVTWEVENLFKTIKQLIRNSVPLSEEETSLAKELTKQLKREIGKLGKTYDEDIFELLAVLQLQLGESNVRNLNLSLRILTALHYGKNKVPIDNQHYLDLSNIFIPKKFIPLTELDVMHTYCAILSLTASEKLEGMEKPLNYLRHRLSEHIKPKDYPLAFIDGIVQYLNNKDETSIPVLKENWYSYEPTAICREFIESALENSKALKGNKPNQVHFLYYCLYNLL